MSPGPSSLYTAYGSDYADLGILFSLLEDLGQDVLPPELKALTSEPAEARGAPKTSGLYLKAHTMFLFWAPVLVLGAYNLKVGYPKAGVWYEPKGRLDIQPYVLKHASKRAP